MSAVPQALEDLTIAEAAELIEARRISPVELTRALIERTQRIDPIVRAYITLFAEEALAEATAAEQAIITGGYRGPLHGIPISLKDLIYAKGSPTTGGSRVLPDFVPDHDAGLVERLRSAGAVITGKVHTIEFGYGAPEPPLPYPPPNNPWALDRTAGGSSAGSAVSLAARLVAGSIGSDTGGSIRIPAHFCGVVGLKPTYGRISVYGVLPLAPSLDHVGPMARTVEDASLILQVVAGYDERDPTSSRVSVPDYRAALSRSVKGLRVGIIREYLDDGTIDPEVRALVENALRVLESAGADVRRVDVPLLSEVEYGSPVLVSEGGASHLPLLRTRYDWYPPNQRRALLRGLAVPLVSYLQYQRLRVVMIARTLDVFETVDVLISPTLPIAANKHEEGWGPITRYTRLFSVLGFPALSVPCGFTASGLPIGMQIAGRPWDEATVLNVADAYQRLTEWHRRRPPLEVAEAKEAPA
jgi:aspartyl-tRNA(Asn)/glutamyl-tRNA(Gln) amidotransferase subunit A